MISKIKLFLAVSLVCILYIVIFQFPLNSRNSINYHDSDISYNVCSNYMDICDKYGCHNSTLALQVLDISADKCNYEVRNAITTLYRLIAENLFGNMSKPFIEIDKEMDFKNINYKNWDTYLFGEFNQPPGIKYKIQKPENRRSLYRTVKIVFDACKQLNLVCYLNRGSLVGSWRHHGNVPWDEDADIVLDAGNQLNITRQLFVDYISEQRRRGVIIHTMSPIWLKVRQGFQWPRVDVGFFISNSTYIKELHDYEGSEHKYEVIFPLRKRPFGHLWVPAPNNPYEYFKDKYPELFNRSCVSVDCLEIKQYAGFVFRVPFLGRVLELVIYGHEVVHTAIVEGTITTLVKPFDFNKPYSSFSME